MIMKQHSNRDYCPVCWELWEDCICEDDYPEESLIERDDEEIQNGFNVY